MHDFSGTDGGKIAVSLIGEHDFIRQISFDTGRDGRRSAMRGLLHIAGKVIVGKNRTSHRSDADGFAFYF
ncbi:hypothetical protein SDC9_188617 [bioreactor metagenome]|uniref:Uncharacterized protein n=1 Tax=bioreactor metagenome TaxID=1076179 RepID=A0A645HQ26_9ZZZZ